MITETGVRYIDREEGVKLLELLMVQNEIPITSTTARCMFSQTHSSMGKRCQFGLTPLWDNELRKRSDGTVLHSEFMDMVRRLIESGLTRQRR